MLHLPAHGDAGVLATPRHTGAGSAALGTRRRQEADARRAVRALGSERNHRGTTAEPPRVPPGRGEPAWEAPQWFPRQRWDAGFLSHHRRWLKYPLRSAAGWITNRHANKSMRRAGFLSPAKCLFSSVFPRARGSPSELEQRDFKFGKNLGNRSSWSANCHSSTEVSRDMTIYTHLGSATG